MSVHYRFKSALEYDTITFDGLHISVKDLKNAIIQQKRIGKSTDFDLRITNAQTQEVYEDESALIPKNTSLLIARVPIITPKPKQWEGYGNNTPPAKLDDGGIIGKAMDLASLDAPEDDKIRAMMSQSTQDYDPSNYQKIRGSNQVGPVPLNYRCYKCHMSGHWIKDCPLGQGVEPVEIKKSTGIPHSFLVPVEGPQVPGAMMMSNGQYAVPALDLQAYSQKSTASVPVQETKPDIPEDLFCSICSDLLTDAVMIPCCGNSFCDECIRSVLLESEDHECPDCREKDISPATLIPNRFLRKSVANFKNTTGYEKKPIFRPKAISKEEPLKKAITPPPEVHSTLKNEEKTVISEADSTEQGKNGSDASKDEVKTTPVSDIEGPPGVSPKSSPKHQISSKITRSERDKLSKDRGHGQKKSPKRRRSRSLSPRKTRNRRSPSFENRRSLERNDTPTKDDVPSVIPENYHSPRLDTFRAVPLGEMMAAGIGPPRGMSMQGPPPPVAMPSNAFTPGQPPPYHPVGVPPNFRLPPPGTQPPPFMQTGPYALPGRSVYDAMAGAPGAFGSAYNSRSRDYGGRRSGRDRTPPGVIDDPLAAFNRILREKDEKRARQQRMARRSWSRSRSRSRSYSRSPPPLRRRTRSPRRRISRSRSRSFSISRSRSRSYSPSPRGSPMLTMRRSSPPLQSRKGPIGRFRSPIRSSPPRRRIERDRLDFDRDRDYDRAMFRDKGRNQRRADSRDRFYDDRDYDRVRGRNHPNLPPPSSMQPQWGAQREPFYPEQLGTAYQNRFPQQIHHIVPERKYEQIAPPGVEQPPVPGLESEFAVVNEFEKQRTPPARQEKDRYSPKERKEHDKERKDHDRDRKDRERRRDSKRSKTNSKTPEKKRNPTPGGTPERPRKSHTSADLKDDKRKEKASHKDKDKDNSEEDKRKSKDKKKHRDKKEDKKKKKDKKERHHHKSKDRKDKKEEFKQVIPKVNEESDGETDEMRKKIEEKRKQREEEEKRKQLEEQKKRQLEEQKKEERRLRFIEDEKRKREEEARKEEAKRRSIEEARKRLEEEEQERVRLESDQQEKTEEEQKSTSLYDEVIPIQDLAKEIRANFNSVSEPAEQNEMPAIQADKERDEETNEGLTINKEIETEEDANVLELHMKLDESDLLAGIPEKSKWEVDETETQQQNSPGGTDVKELADPKTKVSSEVLKRAENVIFARAINSIRPMDMKKGKADEKGEEVKKVEAPIERPRLSVKERLGKKVDEPDPKNEQSSSSPPSRKERRIEVEIHRRRHGRTAHEIYRERDREGYRNRREKSAEKTKRGRKEEKDRREENKDKSRHKRSRSKSQSDESKRKKRDKKPRKERARKTEAEVKNADPSAATTTTTTMEKPKSAVEKRKATLDEANFEPDYDLETHEESELETKKTNKKPETTENESSGSESSNSSSEEERKRKKRKGRKKKKRKETSSSDSDSSTESSDSEKDRKRKKHKKLKKKKKKSRHK